MHESGGRNSGVIGIDKEASFINGHVYEHKLTEHRAPNTAREACFDDCAKFRKTLCMVPVLFFHDAYWRPGGYSCPR